jgi:predicted metal-binding membrane protein
MRYAQVPLEGPRMTEAAKRDLSYLSPAAHGLGAVFARPKLIAFACIAALAGLGWFVLGLQAAGVGLFEVLCRPLATGGAGDAFLIAGMWSAMTLAMMLPSAAPMILTYAEIADTAARKGEAIVSPFVIAAGYTAVWLAFAGVAALAQIMFAHAALAGAGITPASALFSGAIFIGAGLYQFSALKHACLMQCQQPFSFFFANWKTTARGVFGLGLRQGFFCLGCCWAMMLLMFATGVMNVIWMAALGMVMALEKIGTGKRFSHIVGIVLIAFGAGFLISALGHWPGHLI